jgi:hypothetical protein
LTSFAANPQVTLSQAQDAAHAGETSVRLNLVAAWNRLKVITQQPAADYQPGRFG